ncbi:MAG: biotin--[acetyl-CoA-carboxylase] ligase [Bacteroidales bacterium]|nr:biotin--[acetyl-CoA-carboxylase] ligase [Bacteroidales bacterium]
MKIIFLEETDSTNNHAEKLIESGAVNEPLCIITNNQISGKGQGKNVWLSEPGKNLTFSIVCFPDFLPATQQFYLNKAVALSALDLLRKMLPQQSISIKWPNDIFIENKKAAGILIKLCVQENLIKYAIIGIGMNVNQQQFPSELSSAVSLINYLNRETNLKEALEKFLTLFDVRYSQLRQGKKAPVDNDYRNALYKLGRTNLFEYDGKQVHAKLKGVNEYGWIQLETADGELIEGDMNRVKMILD